MSSLNKETEYLTLPSGKLTDITSLTLHKRFQVGNVLHNGENSTVFKCKDADADEKVDKRRGKPMVIKIF
jgi:hypothetical protein